MCIRDSYTGGDEKATAGQGWTMGDSITMSASGDVNDIGVTLSFEIDNDDTGGGDVYDSHSIAFDLGDAGSLTFHGHGGSSALGAKDDVMPTAWEEPWDILPGSEADLVGGAGGDNMFAYSYSHDSGVTGTVTYVNAADAVTDVSSTSYGIEFTGMEGLTVGYAQQDVEVTTNTKGDESTMYATYAYGSFTFGYQVSDYDAPTAAASDDSTAWGISYNITDDFSVSYNEHSVDIGSTTTDQESDGISASYTMGSMSITAISNSQDDTNGVSGNDDSYKELTVGFAF